MMSERIIKFKRDTQFRSDLFTSDSLMRVKFMSSVLFMLFKQPVVLAPITFLASCYQVIKGRLPAFRCWHNVVSLQDNTIFNSPPTVLAGKIIPTQDRKSNSQSSLFQLVITPLTFGTAKPSPMTIRGKCLIALHTIALTQLSRMIFEITKIAVFQSASIRASQAPSISGKFLATNIAMPNCSLMIRCPTTHKSIIA